ncbi:unnamed protein product [Phytomonas sp. Hart1]|nr:unnamed protein product [Phytomonas sp. Hart1]|eukprot:CCW70171.1 unnamed protein product [Phytomonas sp. isolate Hart1]
MDLEGDQRHESFIPKIHCCICGLLIDSNPSNMCPNCLRAHVDIVDDIQKEYILIYCPECQRYMQPPNYWARADFESRELLTICLKRIKGIKNTTGGGVNSSSANKARLVDAKFMWSEPHSKRILVNLTVQKEVLSNIVIQQSCQIQYVVNWQQCPTCQKVATGQPQWDACIQLRQKVSHKKTFLYLEQVILKKRLHENFTRIENQPDGLDFYFGHKSHALNFIEFLHRMAPVTRRDAVQLVSHDSKNNTAVQHYTYSLDIAPICRGDLVLLPYKDFYLKSMGGMGPLVLVHKVYSSIVFFDPKTLRAGEVTGSLYWKKPFPSLLTTREMSEFYVLECSPMAHTNGIFQLGLVTVCLSSEIGKGREWVVQSHLGGILNPGDLVKGYLLSSRNISNEDLDDGRYRPEELQDVVLVHKFFPSQGRHRNRRLWKLKKLDIVTSQGDRTTMNAPRHPGGVANSHGVSSRVTRHDNHKDDANDDEAEFEDEIEWNKELRKDINIYRKMESEMDPIVRRHQADNEAGAQYGHEGVCVSKEEDEDDEEIPQISLEEMLDELQIGDGNESATETNDVGPSNEQLARGSANALPDDNEDNYNKKLRIG